MSDTDTSTTAGSTTDTDVSGTGVSGTGGGAAARTRHATLHYTVLRLGIFAACYVVIALLAYVGALPEAVGAANPLWIVLLSIVVSAPLSFVLLRRQRDAMSEQLVPHVDRARERLRANRSMEDEDAPADVPGPARPADESSAADATDPTDATNPTDATDPTDPTDEADATR